MVIALLICNTETKAQVLKFIGEVYSTEPVLDDIYTLKIVSLSEIFAKMIQCSTYFSRKSLNSFSSFCGKNKLDFMKDEDSRKRSKNETGSYTRLWSLYVLEDKYHGKVKVFRIDFLIDFLFVANVIKNILEYNEKYQEFLKTQKELGVEIVGYVRKSSCDKNEQNRIRLIKRMVDNLRSRSIVDKVFVSKTSDADQPFHKRDINADTIEETDGTTTGNRQYMLKIILN